MSNSSTNSTNPDLSTHYQHISIGTTSVLLNCAVLYTLVSNKHLLLKSAFVFGFAVGDLLDGVALLGNGAARMYQVLHHLETQMVHPSYCLQVYGITAVFMMGNQIPGVMFLLVGLERLLAVQFFQWYYLKWSNKIAWVCTSCAFGFCALSTAMAFVVANSMKASMRIQITCQTQQAVGVPYITYNYLLCIICGMVAIATTIWAMVAFTKRRQKINATRQFATNMRLHINRQWNTTRIMVLMAVLDLVLVVMPYVLLVLKNGFGLDAVQNLGVLSLQLGCSRSFPNIFVYFFVNKEFRKAAFKSIGIKPASIGIFHQTIIPTVSNHPTASAY